MGIISWLTGDSTRYPEEPGWVRRLVLPRRGRIDTKAELIKQAAAAQVAAMEAEDREYFRQDGPGHYQDEL